MAATHFKQRLSVLIAFHSCAPTTTVLKPSLLPLPQIALPFFPAWYLPISFSCVWLVIDSIVQDISARQHVLELFFRLVATEHCLKLSPSMA